MNDSVSASRRVTDLLTVLEVSRELAATADLVPLLRKIEQAALQVLRCERATVFLFDSAAGELFSRFATGVDEIRFPADQGIAGEVVRTGAVIEVPVAYADPRFNREIDRRTGFRTRNMIALPLLGFDGATVGVLQVLNKIDGGFDAWDRQLAETLGGQVGVVLQRQLLLEQYAEKQRLQADLNIARDIQRNLLPERPPEVPGFDLAGFNQPADETGGDCYDFMPLEDGCVGITIADATGHGIGPALVIAECRALFRATIGLSRDLAANVCRINDLLCEDLPSDRFVTAFFGLLDPADGSLVHHSAGHGPLIQYRRAEDRFTELKPSGIPLGIMRGARFDAPQRLVMSPGDLMVLVTDGFLEWARADGEQFGAARLEQTVRRHRDEPSAAIIDAIREAVLSFAAGTPQADDLTAVVIRRT